MNVFSVHIENKKPKTRYGFTQAAQIRYDMLFILLTSLDILFQRNCCIISGLHRFPFTTHSFGFFSCRVTCLWLTPNHDNTPLSVELKNTVEWDCYFESLRVRHFMDIQTVKLVSLPILLSQKEGEGIMTRISSPQHVPTGLPIPIVNRKEWSVLGFLPWSPEAWQQHTHI